METTMTFEANMQGFFEASAIGLLLAIGFIFLVALSNGWARLWAWMDDATPQEGPMTKLLRKWLGKEDHRDSIELYIPCVLSIWLCPIVIWFIYNFFSVALFFAIAFAVAHLTRYVRRVHKAFKKHVEDKDAHK